MLSSAQAAVVAALADRERVSAEQAAFARANGDIFLTACPGSGKTRSVGLRLAFNAAFCPERSIAAVSHTNTAERAIRDAAGELIALPYHYFVGTLHTFLLKYVVYPFGHLYMRCDASPEVLDDDDGAWPEDLPDTFVGDWKGQRIKSWRFDVAADKTMTYRRPREWPQALSAELVVAAKGEWAQSEKRKYWERGLLSFSDVLYVAMRVLEHREDVRAAVAARFDELIVDEAQDANDVQLKCLQLLRAVKDRRPSLVAVGDVDQAIYEWGRATPAELKRVIAEEQLADLPLWANYRSSERICRVTHRFSTRATAENARGEHADCDLAPELWDAEAEQAVGRFRERLEELAIPESDSAALVRTRAQRDSLNDVASKEPWHYWLGVLGRAAHARDAHGPDREVFDALRRAVASVAYKTSRPRGLGDDARDRLHEATCALLESLPAAVGDLRAFNLAARDALAAAARAARGGDKPEKNARSVLRDVADLAGYDAADAFAPAPAPLARTIHDAKGATIDAVLVIARPEDLADWTAEVAVRPRPPVLLEDTRLAYVALSRAQRLLVVATPRPSRGAIELLADVGFVMTP